tara:strand:+ start:411 stop:668 length:258 start_codon:yes stop_codon:yes gene_type:complete
MKIKSYVYHTDGTKECIHFTSKSEIYSIVGNDPVSSDMIPRTKIRLSKSNLEGEINNPFFSLDTDEKMILGVQIITTKNWVNLPD